jgi:hypothetical protein
MSTLSERATTLTSAELFALLHGQQFRHLGELENAVHTTAWESFPAFRPSSLFNAQRYTEWAIEQGWVERTEEGGFVVVVGGASPSGS